MRDRSGSPTGRGERWGKSALQGPFKANSIAGVAVELGGHTDVIPTGTYAARNAQSSRASEKQQLTKFFENRPRKQAYDSTE